MRALESRRAAARPVPPTRSVLVARASLGWHQASAKAELLRLVSTSSRGLTTSKDQAAAIQACVLQLEGAAATETTQAALLSATWKLLWTTEKETLWILKNAGFFCTSAGEVYQVIDVDKGYLQNVVTFPPEGAFVVDSDLSVAGPQRCDFKFRAARLKLPGARVWDVPPFGQGWFDTVYLDEDLRVARDSRGDTLIVGRAGPPSQF